MGIRSRISRGEGYSSRRPRQSEIWISEDGQTFERVTAPGKPPETATREQLDGFRELGRILIAVAGVIDDTD